MASLADEFKQAPELVIDRAWYAAVHGVTIDMTEQLNQTDIILKSFYLPFFCFFSSQQTSLVSTFVARTMPGTGQGR